MEIYILRHGAAEDPKPGAKDSDRALTPDGKKKLRIVLARARAVGVEPAIILTSPYRRARETAQVAQEILAGEGTLLETKALTPESRPEAVWDEIRPHSEEKQILIVGHEPLLSTVYAYLLGPVQVDVKKGALGRIDVNHFGGQPRGVLRWLIHPKLAGEE